MIRLYALGMKLNPYLVKSKPHTDIMFGSWLTLVFKYKSANYIVSLIPCHSVVCIPNREKAERLDIQFNDTVIIDLWQVALARIWR